MKLLPMLVAVLAIGACQHTSQKQIPEVPAAPVTAAAVPANPRALFDLPHEQRLLPNGLRIIAVKTPTPGVVSLQIPVQTGSRNEVEPGKSGFAHFFEHMMFRGTAKYPPGAYGAVIKSAGGDQNAYTSDDFTNYYVNFTTADLERMLEVESDRFQNLSYSEEQFRTEAQAVKGEYLKNYSNPIQKASERLRDIAFDVHPYKHTTMGFFADIENMPNQIEYSREFFDRWYRPEYTSIIVAGDIDINTALAAIEKYWGDWKPGGYKSQIPIEPASSGARYEHVHWQAPTLPWLLHGFRAPAASTKNFEPAALALAAELYFGPASDLYQKLVIRDRLVETLFVSAPRNRDPGLFTIAVQLSQPENAARVNAAIDQELARMRAYPLPARRVIEARSRLKYSFAAGMSSAAGVASILATFVQFERDVDTLNRYYALLDSITPEQIQVAANQVFRAERRATVSLSNGESLEGANGGDLDAILQRLPAETRASTTESDPEYAPFATSYTRNVEDLYFPVFARPSASQLVDFSLVFRSGAGDDPPGKKGLAALTARLIVDSDTARRSLAEIRQRFYPIAGGLNVQVDKHLTRFSAQIHRDNLQVWYPLAREMLLEPGFLEADLARVKQQQLTALRVQLRGNNDEELAKEKLYEEIYGDSHPYGSLNLGHAKDIEAISLDDVKAFYRAYYSSDRLAIGTAGNEQHNILDRLSEDMLGLPSPGTPLPALPALPKLQARSATIIEKETPAVAVSFGWPIAVNRSSPDWAALWLVRSWLGEHRNSNGRLYNRIRELRGMNYGDYAYIEYFPSAMYLMQPEPNMPRVNDLFQVWLRPLRNNNDALFATRVALHELQTLHRDGMKAADFEATREFLKKFASILVADQSKQLGYFIDSHFFGIGEFTEHVRTALDQLNLEKVNAALRTHLDPTHAHFVFVTRDAEALSEALQQDLPSPITYNAEKPEAVSAEDRVIEKLRIGIAGNRIRIEPAAQVFE
ncbi:MAG: pitrilysin family protein [Pseudomonadota bacterium]|nr:pitrilysin family protein [Pseudomonadota bacterium]